MEDIFKRIIYTSVGFVSQASSKIKEVIDELIRDRKISEEEGKRIVEEFSHKTKGQTKDLEEQIKQFSARFNKDGENTTTAEIESLKNKIKMLEQQLMDSKKNSSFEPDTYEREGLNKDEDPLQAKKEVFQHKLNEQEIPDSTIDKVVNSQRVSLQDEVLTPEKKMEAEQKRMHTSADRPSAERREEDSQKSNLSGPILTPGKKMENDSMDQQ